MSRKTLLILTAIALVILSIWVYFSYRTPGTPAGTNSTNSIGSLFPFGPSKNQPATNTPSTTPEPTNTTPTETPASTTPSKLVQLTKRYIAGFTVLPASANSVPVVNINDTSGTQTTSTIPRLRFAERGTGYIYDIDATGANLAKTSGTVIAHTLIALFGDDGNTVVLRYIKSDNETIATYLGRLLPSNDPNSSGTTSGSFLSDNIPDLVMSPDKKNILYLLPSANGVAGMTMKNDGTGRKQLFMSSFSEWLLDWPKSGPVLTSKAAATIPGYAYAITASGIFSKILGPTKGLTTKMSPDGQNILYSVSNNGSIDLHIKNIKSGTDHDAGLSTLPEKCVWNVAGTTIYCGAGTSLSAGEYPDSWYQGAAHFNDALWKIDPTTGTTTELNDGEGNYIDATNLTLDTNEQYLIFVNKNDASLWSLNLAK